MSERYCTRCANNVEDVGGYCLLGHPLRLQPETSALQQLRSQVDEAFEEARMQVTAALDPAVPPPLAPSTLDAEPLPARVAVAPPPPPPARTRKPAVWQALEVETSRPVAADPIAAFAPPPRMDWGPERGLLRRRPRRRVGELEH